jgi:hypothetical protein
MLSNLQSGIVKVIRTSGKALDSIGKSFEVYPYVESCKTTPLFYFCGLAFLRLRA